jgi:hypothetical protein
MNRRGVVLGLCTLLTLPAIGQYCGAGITNACSGTFYEYISNVTIDVVNNTTMCTVTPAYSDYTAVGPANAPVTVATPVSVTVSNYWGGDTIMLWCDWDNSQTFDASGLLGNELTILPDNGPGGSGSAPWTFTGSITPPLGSAVATRMRVILRYDSTLTTPCPTTANDTFGEIEDYQLNVVGGGGPIPCTTSFSSPAGAGSVTVTNNACAALAGASYFWAFSFAQGTTPNGNWHGLDIGLAQLVQWYVSGYPFIGTLDGSGASSFGVGAGSLPSGLPIWQVTTTWAPGFTNFLLAYPTTSYVIP